MRKGSILLMLIGLGGSAALAEKFFLINGVDVRRYPGTGRQVVPDPGPGFPGTFYDGDRLAGTSDVGPQVPYVGTGQPMYQPNYLGSLSLLFRRGSVPAQQQQIPFMAIEFLGGPLLDLDGDPNNGERSLIPVPPHNVVELPGTDSFLELVLDPNRREIRLLDFDATGCNEGGPQLPPGIATILVTIAGTQPDGSKTGPINFGVDTRVGMLAAFPGKSGTIRGVYRVTDLGFELWEDGIDPFLAHPEVLGSMQYLGYARGWVVTRDPNTGLFPKLAGEGLGATLWPKVETLFVGTQFKTANDLEGGTAVITDGVPQDRFTAPNNGGVALTDFGGDLGAYLDKVVAGLLPAAATRYVYLESAGCGINNSRDPVFTDTISYDAVLLAANATCGRQKRGDANCDAAINFADINCFVAALADEMQWRDCAAPGCDYLCVNDANGDGRINFADINPFVALLGKAD